MLKYHVKLWLTWKQFTTISQSVHTLKFKPVRSQMKISYGRCSDTPHISFSWSSVVNQSPPITEGGRRPSCLVILRRFIGNFWSWILAVGHGNICQIIQMLEFYVFFIKIFLDTCLLISNYAQFTSQPRPLGSQQKSGG